MVRTYSDRSVFLRVLAVALYLLPSVSSAEFYEGPAAPSSLSARPTSILHGLEVVAGPSIFESEVGVALALRYPLGGKFVLDVGGTLPHQVTHYPSAEQATPTIRSKTRVSSFAESHLVLLYPLYQKSRYKVEAGAGLSVGVLNDYSTGTDNGSYFIHEKHKAVPSPLIQLGACAALTAHLGFRVDVGWVHYKNDTGYPQAADLALTGIVVRPGVTWVF